MNKPNNPLDTLGLPTARRQSRMLDPVLLLLLLEHDGACGMIWRRWPGNCRSAVAALTALPSTAACAPSSATGW